MSTRVAVRRLHIMTYYDYDWAFLCVLHATDSTNVWRRAEGHQALKHFRCPACEERKKPAPRPATRPPSDYRFNVEIAVDCFEIRDVEGSRFTTLSIVDMGALDHVAEIVSDKGGAPSSRACADVFRRVWLNWAGPPKSIIVDRGLHNRGCFSELLTYHGVQMRFIGVEAHHQLGRGEQGASSNIFYNMLWKQGN